MTNNNEPRETTIRRHIKQLRAQQYQASQARNSGSVMRINRELEKLYKELDKIEKK